MKSIKSSVMIKSILWCIVVLLFPIGSGVLSGILSLDVVDTLFLQGCFMLLSLLPPLFLVLCRKWKWSDIGITRFDLKSSRSALYFLPVLLIFIPAAVKGFFFKSAEYAFGSLFLYFIVGIAEETYFRGIIPYYLKKAFSLKGVVLYSTLIFGLGHMATAFSGSSVFEVVITVLNAVIFGFMAIEITLICKNIIPMILIHFFSNYETKIVALEGKDLLTAECIRGCLMCVIALWLAFLIHKNNQNIPK